jgi:hypothetical protein
MIFSTLIASPQAWLWGIDSFLIHLPLSHRSMILGLNSTSLVESMDLRAPSRHHRERLTVID